MKIFRTYAVLSAVLACLLAILGSWVRINGAGMTCPDWPLCKGSLVPALEGGVILEWTHRLVAALEGVVLTGAIFTGWKARKKIAGVTPVLVALGAIFVVQVGLGGLTVQLANRPDSVVWHWVTAMALLAALTVLATLSLLAPIHIPRINRAAASLGLAALGAIGVMSAGAYVSSSGAGLACTTLPGCGDVFWGVGPPQIAQMLHRGLAALFVLLAIVGTTLGVLFSKKARMYSIFALVLVGWQIALGIANVVWILPTAMREAHAANAVATFLMYVIAATVAAIEAAQPAPARSIPTLRGQVRQRASFIQGARK